MNRNTTITHCRPTHHAVNKSYKTPKVTRHLLRGMCITQILLGQGTRYNSSLLDYVHGYLRDISPFQQILHHKWFKTSEGEVPYI